MAGRSLKNLAAIALLLEEEEEEKVRGQRKRLWVHQSLKKRKCEGEFWTLYKELADDEAKFYQYFRMSKAKFNYLREKIEMDLAKMNTNCREAVPPKRKTSSLPPSNRPGFLEKKSETCRSAVGRLPPSA
ncbi:hypothetical protein Hamer_G014703 [Homarus americanus]|uniref:Uncharacterized protein n=1 Tax=Homarus americanus TaxID=6706 RepID=A0A8J5N1K7_HOMAM|nr:hypothetical protein Hamer_G014703 [Homarus americanus]